MRIAIIGSSRYSYKEAVEILPRVWRTALPFFNQPTAIGYQAGSALGSVVKSYFVNQVTHTYDLYGKASRNDGMVVICGDARELARSTMQSQGLPCLCICPWTGRMYSSYHIPSTKFCRVYGWKPGDVLENPDDKSMLRINRIDIDKVIGQRANEFSEKFGEEMEIFPNERYARIGSVQEILGE